VLSIGNGAGFAQAEFIRAEGPRGASRICTRLTVTSADVFWRGTFEQLLLPLPCSGTSVSVSRSSRVRVAVNENELANRADSESSESAATADVVCDELGRIRLGIREMVRNPSVSTGLVIQCARAAQAANSAVGPMLHEELDGLIASTSDPVIIQRANLVPADVDVSVVEQE